ncbi:hypothetical protein BHM03_00020290 [Ensete ventricosum]|nr:hypothetical protein BHM03_00020290 [Ensete ventricosum]
MTCRDSKALALSWSSASVPLPPRVCPRADLSGVEFDRYCDPLHFGGDWWRKEDGKRLPSESLGRAVAGSHDGAPPPHEVRLQARQAPHSHRFYISPATARWISRFCSSFPLELELQCRMKDCLVKYFAGN